MKTIFKRAAAWFLTALMILNCVPVYAQDTSTDYSGQQISLADYVTVAEDITVTFVINNSNYTSDPGSGNTHITAKAAIEGGDLAYTSWASRYKVTGTGTVCSYTIPSGTSLSANGYSFPAITVENIGNTNTYTYSSLQTWITSKGMVCNTGTTFAEDTTLYLQLYESGAEDVYSVDFVCGEDNHSIKSIGSFLLGQSLSQAHIDAATEAANSFESQFCTYGPASSQSLQKWQLKETATGEMADLYAGMPITEKYVNSQYGTSIKAYAVWETASVPVSATFQHVAEDETGTQTVTEIEVRSLNTGDVLGELPDMSNYETEATEDTPAYIFLGWQYADADGNLLFATPETVITADTIYTAVFGEENYLSVVFHDIMPDGTESTSLDFSVTEGQTISQIIAENDGDLADGKPISECVWYTLDASGAKTPADLSAVVAEETHLYTYTYQIVLTMNPNSTAEASIMTLSLVETETAADGTITMTITAREGEQLTAADFVMEDGTDLMLYTWKDANGNAIDLQDLIDNGVSENITVASDGTLNTTLSEHKGHSVNFYVFIDDEPVKVASRTVTDYTSGSRHYLTAATLASVYGRFGFSASQLRVGTRYFPHTDAGGATIWADTAVLEDNGLYFSPITNGGAADVYYLPKQTLGATYGSYTDHIAQNTFYTVKVEDPFESVYAADELPGVIYTLVGNTATVTVEEQDGVEWQCIGKDGTTTGVSSTTADGKTTFTISSISQPYTISPMIPDGKAVVAYDVNLLGTPSDEEYGTPLVNGELTYFDTVDAIADYTVLAPSITSYFYTSGKYLGEATFLGWAVNGDTTNLLQPGAVLDLTQYNGQKVTLTAQWEPDFGAAANSSMVNFFVALNAVSEGTTAWTGNVDQSKFTSSVYTSDCGVTGYQVIENNLYEDTDPINQHETHYFVLGTTSGDNLAGRDGEIRKLASGVTIDGVPFQCSFPSTETVLRNVRAMVDAGTEITINGRKITSEELTTTNFTIMWYVFKVSNADGWHIDGILVAKTAQLKVSKTFAGDDKAIAEVKDNYSISVSGGATHTGGTLTTDNANSSSGNKYTWLVDVDQYYDYVVTENNWQSDASLTTSTSQYRVLNSVNNQNTGGWNTYSGGITVTGQGHNEQDDDRLTVDFLNTYTAPGTVIFQKIDAATGNLMSGVDFNISRTMYDQGGGRYSADPADGGTATTTITTNSAGQAYLWIGGGTYTLTEEVPTGYDDPGTITAELQGDDDNAYKVVKIKSLSASNDDDDRDFTAISGDDYLTLVVKNYSRAIDLVVEKEWLDDENTPVTIQLMRNETALGENYTVSMDSTTGWTHTFTGLPLYADGALAEYTLREEEIGEFKYSDEYSDGYRYYNVNRSAMQYLDASGSVTSDMTAVEKIKLTVSNERSNGSMSIAKVDETGVGLGGAEFYLYEAPSGEDAPPDLAGDAQSGYTLSGATLKSSTTSAANGAASFANINAGRYFLIEHKAPTGYTGSTTVYELQFDGDRASMRYWDGDSWESTVLRVTNVGQTTSKTVTKVWDDSNNIAGLRPESIILTLTGKVSDKVVHTQSATLTADNGDEEVNFADGTTTASSTWTHEFTNVPLYSGGSEITYTVSENELANYTTTYDQSTLTVTNTLGVTDVTITKQITGNFADPNATFPFTAVVTVDGETVILDANTGYTVAADGTISFSLSDNGSVVIKNVPMQATVTVSETPGDYSASYQIGSNAVQEGKTAILNVANGQTAVTFTNDRTAQIDTGVDLDTIPYVVMLLSIFGAGALWLIGRRRRTQN